ncbi:MAG TPA: hypothetical protein VF557_04365 [Jatrophihabitans sp.]|uniref:hypothetical protein n=1 Tax=Jatrophihabitans sp. TaxID=1932789 RepID=UPI002F0880DC
MTMPTARPIQRSTASLELDIVWGAWAELGVSGWGRSHREWAVDPEPLIIVTPLIAARDARLRDEALDWCIHNWRHISRVRLRNLLRAQPADVVDAYAGFAATVNAHGGASWPGESQAWSYATTGRSTPPVLSRDSLIWLRMRAMFGVSARTEILRYFLAHEQGRASVTTLATASGYTKRNIADECTTLQRAGVLAVRSTMNRLYYSLDRDSQLRAFVGEPPPVLPDWTALFGLSRALVKLSEDASRLPVRALNVEAGRSLNDLEDELDRLYLSPPALQDDSWSAVRHFTDHTLKTWARGQWHNLT